MMEYDYLDYGKLIDDAMHYVVRRSLEHVVEKGLPGDHHFFITFDTHHPGVMISEELMARYPEEMTIVIQHQFWDLEVNERGFSLVLSFDNVKQNLTIPFEALISFADPSVKFGLQFHHEPIDDEDELLLDTPVEKGKGGKKKGKNSNNVVTLDTFRKKK